MRDYASLLEVLLRDLDVTPDNLRGYTHTFSDMSPRVAACYALASSFYKKLQPLGDTKQADAKALEKFKAINDGLSGPEWVFIASSEAESCFYDYFKDNLRIALEPHESLGSFDLDFIRENMGVGPGASQKADSRCMTTKLFESSISYINPDLITLYRSALAGSGLWSDAEMQRYQDYGFTKVKGGKLFFAIKNAEISRVCCTEALLESLIQRACGEFIERRLEWSFGINLSYQPDNNRELARIGSLDGSIGTIDLVSASDSIMLQLCKDALPEGFFKRTLLACRSRFAVLPNGEEVELKMVSTMGNGFTFPLQTLIFSCAVRAVYQLMGFPSRCPKTEFGVFGDDICVRRETYTFVVAMLNKLGFKVNVSKSFNTGPFRESCGHDYANGINIRGVYITSLETPQQVYSAINRLTRWSALHGVDISSTLRVLLSWVRDMRIPLSAPDDGGIKVPFKLSIPKLDDGYNFKYRYYKRRISRLKVPEPDAESDHKFNQLGVAVGFLAGVLRRPDVLLTNLEDSAWKHDVSVSVPLRDRRGARPRYSVASQSLPWWDYLPNPRNASWSDQGNTPEGVDRWRQPLTRLSHHAWESVMVAII